MYTLIISHKDGSTQEFARDTFASALYLMKMFERMPYTLNGATMVIVG